MTALLQQEPFLTWEEYLALDESSPVRHEYFNGYVEAMTGGSGPHHVISSNLIIRLGAQLLGKRCFPYGSDRRLHIEDPGEAWGYFPDVTVDCTGVVAAETTAPTVIFEVLSDSTRHKDFVDKRINYLARPSMLVYVLVEQTHPHLTIYRRGKGETWPQSPEVLAGVEATLALPEIECILPLRHIYERVEFVAVE